MSSSVTTIDHDVIQGWVERHGGKPAKVTGTNDLLRIDFPGPSGEESLEEISWEEFFESFEKNDLAFLYDPTSRFNKFISRENLTEGE